MLVGGGEEEPPWTPAAVADVQEEVLPPQGDHQHVVGLLHPLPAGSCHSLKAQAWAYLCSVPCSPVLPAVEYPAADPGHGEAQGGEGGQEQLGVLGGGGEEEEEEEGCWVEVGKPVRRRSAGWRWVGL